MKGKSPSFRSRRVIRKRELEEVRKVYFVGKEMGRAEISPL